MSSENSTAGTHPLLARLFAFALATLGIGSAVGDEVVQSPDGKLSISFLLSEGAPTYRVDYSGRALIQRSRLGFEPGLLDRFTLTQVERAEYASSWSNPLGERRETPDRFHELHCDLEHQSGAKLRITLRAYNEGVALRYAFPEQTIRQFRLTSERTEFRFPAGTYGWEEHGTEGPYQRVPVGEIRPWCERPLTLEYRNGVFASLTEAANFNYPRMLLSPADAAPNVLVSALGGNTSNSDTSTQRDNIVAVLNAGDSTPWRVLVVGDRPGDLLERNYLVLNLNPPCAISDTSWIKPGKAMRETALTTKNAKAVIDFAEQGGHRYVHFDAGWYGPERDRASDATTVDPERSAQLDLAEVVRYGRQKGVGVLVYVNKIALKRQLSQLLPLYQQWGLKGVKFGFVDVGPQSETAWITAALKQAAEHRLMLNIHDNYRSTGVHRTYPNLMTVEGIRGNEHMPTAAHNCTLPFTRYVTGIGDYTICYYNNRINTTHAHQLAMNVISFSPLQWIYWYDRPDMYHGEPEIEFFREVPTVWGETRVLHGEIGKYAMVARRSGDAWFVGAINAGEARTLDAPLDFLTLGREYLANIYSDDATIDTRTKVRVERIEVTSDSTLHADLSPSGGQAVWIRPRD